MNVASCITPFEVARRMVEASTVDVEGPDGVVIEAWTIEAAGDTVRASAPRLKLWAGMQLWWRFLDESGIPQRAELDLLEAQFKSDSRAAILLQVVAVTPDQASRKHKRCLVSGSVLLTAVNCERIVDTDHVRAVLHDLSVSGVALVTHDERVRPGDRLALRTRFIDGALDSHIRVARVSHRPGSGDILLGALFLDPTDELVATVERVMGRFGTHRRAEVGQPIRASLGISAEDHAPTGDTPERHTPLFARRPKAV
jgi:hypothetical protein